MKESEEKCRRHPPVPAASLLPGDVFGRNDHDACRDHRLDDTALETDDSESGEGQRQSVRERECAHDLDEVPERDRRKDKGADEQEVVESGEDVVDPVAEIREEAPRSIEHRDARSGPVFASPGVPAVPASSSTGSPPCPPGSRTGLWS